MATGVCQARDKAVGRIALLQEWRGLNCRIADADAATQGVIAVDSEPKERIGDAITVRVHLNSLAI